MSRMRLCHCPKGTTGIVTDVVGGIPLYTRLQELGLFPGETVNVLHTGYLMILGIGDSRFCVRRDQVRGVSLALLSDTLDTVELHESLSSLSVVRSTESV